MIADIEAGNNLAHTLERAGIVSQQTLALIRLGEASGHLVENLELAAQQEEKRRLFRAKVRSALIYPLFVLSLTLIVGLGIAWFLLPKLSNTFSQLHVKLPLISKLMIGFGVFLREYGIIAVPAFLLAGAGVVYVLFGLPQTKIIGQYILLKIPGLGRLMREVEIAQFGYLLGTLLNAGLSVTQAVTLLAEASSLRQYQRLYHYMVTTLEDGYSFKDSLARYKHSMRLLPPAVQQMIVAGERSGSLSNVLITIGRTYEQKADITTANLEAVIEPILLVIVWIGVMLVAVGVILPIYSLVGGLGQ
jgi:type II secretory pathway component PulF